MGTRRNELTRQAARLFAEKGYHGTSIGDLAQAMGVQKGSLYAHIDAKADLLWEVARDGAAAFHAGLGNAVERAVERVRTLSHRLVEQILLRRDVGVERALLDAHCLGQVADGGAVIALRGEEPGRLTRQLVSPGAHVGYPNDR